MTLKETICTLALFLIGQVLYAQTVQGCIDYDKVIVTMPKYATDQKDLETRTKLLNDSIDKLICDFQHFMQTEIPHQVKMDFADRTALERILESLRMKIDDYQRYTKKEINRLQRTIEIDLKNIAIK